VNRGVELEQAGGRGELGLGQRLGGGVGDLDEELIAHRAEKPFDLAAALGAVRGGVHQPDPELAAGPQQPRIHEGGSVVHVAVSRHPSAGQGWLQGGGQAHGVLGEAEPGTDREAGMIVKEREEIRFAAPHAGAVQGVADPPLVGDRGLEPAEGHAALAGGRAHQCAAVKQPQQRGLRG